MGSRIIHLAIAKKIAQTLDLNEQRFNLGSLIPDAHKNYDEKSISHFQIKGVEFGAETYLDLNGFLIKYKNMLKDHLYLGYYVHLLSDNHWLKHVYEITMLDDNMCIRTELQEDYYNDYQQMNARLIQAYNLENTVEFKDYQLNEINTACMAQVKKGLRSDFRSNPVEKVYKVLTPEMVNEHIEAVAKLSIQALKKVGIHEIIK